MSTSSFLRSMWSQERFQIEAGFVLFCFVRNGRLFHDPDERDIVLCIYIRSLGLGNWQEGETLKESLRKKEVQGMKDYRKCDRQGVRSDKR